MCLQLLTWPEEDIKSPETRVPGGCSLACLVWVLGIASKSSRAARSLNCPTVSLVPQH